MKDRAINNHPWFYPALGAVLSVLCGWLLWATALGDGWSDASYDYLFKFGERAVTNKVTLIYMDEGSHEQLHQPRTEAWDRAKHAQLLDRLADDGCAMVVFDSFFQDPGDQQKDAALAAAMRRQKQVVLMAEDAAVESPQSKGVELQLPADIFINAAGTNNWGLGYFSHGIVRQHWPFPSPGAYPSLAWTAAKLMGAKLSETPRERWMRYYGPDGAWNGVSYQLALSQPTNYYRNQIVFIGNRPKTTVPDDEADKFSTPYTLWTHQAVGGVELHATEFLNLMNDDALERPPGWLEWLLLTVSGILLGGGLCRLRLVPALTFGMASILGVAVLSVSLSYYTNYWYPWLIIIGGQAPCAMLWALATSLLRQRTTDETWVMEPAPKTPGYKLIHAFGKGSYGKVWLARTASGQWRALKVVYRSKFGDNPAPYEREYSGVQKYMPISDQHPGLLRVEFVSPKTEEYFYYVMELGDSLVPDWEMQPKTYAPRDLSSERARLPGNRLSIRDCVHLGIKLAQALDFLHAQGMTHRDIKPQNIIFVGGEPKLADVGLLTEIRPEGEERTIVGTPGFMPPLPERPGTPQADVFSLGMALYVAATGRNAAEFPEFTPSLITTEEPVGFMPLNAVILKACQPDIKQRHASAAELTQALQRLLTLFEQKPK